MVSQISLYGIIFVKRILLFFSPKYGTIFTWLGTVFSRKVRNIHGPGFVPPSGFQGLITSITTVNRQTYSSVSGFNIVDSLLE